MSWAWPPLPGQLAETRLPGNGVASSQKLTSPLPCLACAFLRAGVVALPSLNSLSLHAAVAVDAVARLAGLDCRAK